MMNHILETCWGKGVSFNLN